MRGEGTAPDVFAATGRDPGTADMPAGFTTGTTVGVVPMGMRAGLGIVPGGRGWTIGGVSTAGTDFQIALAFPIVWVQRPALKNLVHCLLIVLQSPVKNRNIESIKKINPQFAMVDPVDSPKLIVIAITLGS